MRIGVVSDVHGNLHALGAVVAALQGLGVDRWVCAGDVVGYGPHPNECVEVLLGLQAIVVAGNHELVATGALPAESGRPLVQRSHEWTARVLRQDLLDELRTWPLRAELDSVVVAHGSLERADEYVSSSARCEREIGRLQAEHPRARFLILGHTHKQRVHIEGEGSVRLAAGVNHVLPDRNAVLLNPGSVGQSREWEYPPRARAALLDTTERRALLLSVRYDVYGSWRDARRHGCTYASLHRPPSVAYLLRRRARALLTSAHRR